MRRGEQRVTRLRRLLTIWLAVTASFGSACAAKSTFLYKQLPDGRWESNSGKAGGQSDLAEAAVTCDRTSATVKITWYAESGDWTAYDTYSPRKHPYFTRVLRFAQFPVQVKVTKANPSSQAEVDLLGSVEDVNTYRNSVETPIVETFDSFDDFPFLLPKCARRYF